MNELSCSGPAPEGTSVRARQGGGPRALAAPVQAEEEICERFQYREVPAWPFCITSGPPELISG